MLLLVPNSPRQIVPEHKIPGGCFCKWGNGSLLRGSAISREHGRLHQRLAFELLRIILLVLRLTASGASLERDDRYQRGENSDRDHRMNFDLLHIEPFLQAWREVLSGRIMRCANRPQRLTRRLDCAGFYLGFLGACVCFAGCFFALSGSGGGAPASCSDAAISSSRGRTPSIKTKT